jgi:hypothetical protein
MKLEAGIYLFPGEDKMENRQKERNSKKGIEKMMMMLSERPCKLKKRKKKKKRVKLIRVKGKERGV